MKKSILIILALAVALISVDADAKVKKKRQRRQPRYEAVEGAPRGDDAVVVDSAGVFLSPDVLPKFRGGTQALVKFIGDNLVYPEQAERAGIEGQVLVDFVVEKNGRVGRIKLRRSVHRWLDNEAMRVAAILPPFIPALVDGKPVACWYSMPINFKLDDPEDTGATQ